MITKALWGACLALTLAGGATAAASDPDAAAKISAVETRLTAAVVVKGQSPAWRTLAARMAANHTPGVSVTVIDHGQIAWSKAYGVITAGESAPVTTTTRFQAASISKTFAAAAAVSLAVDGAIDLDAPVNSALKGWALPASPLAPGYIPSVRALLSHAGGVGVHGFAGYAVGAPRPTLTQVLDGVPPANSAAVRIDYKPGVWEYSGGGTTIVQKLIEDVTGRPIADVVGARILTPVGLTNTTYSIPDPADLTFATAHHGDGEPISGRWHVYPEAAAAGVWTTPEDLAKWALAVARAKAGDPRGGVDPRVAQRLLEPQPGLNTGSGAMGLGFFLNQPGAALRFGHGGANEGFRCDLIYYPETGQGVAVMTNSDTGGALLTEIERAVAAAYHWPQTPVREVTTVPAAPETLRRLAGVWGMGEMKRLVVVSREGDGLAAALWDGRRVQLTPIEGDAFINLDDGLTLSSGAAPDELTVTPAQGAKLTLKRTE